MTTSALPSGSARGAAGTARRPDDGHAHRFIIETLEAAMQRQPDVPYNERTVLGACHCGATTKAKAFFRTSYSPRTRTRVSSQPDAIHDFDSASVRRPAGAAAARSPNLRSRRRG